MTYGLWGRDAELATLEETLAGPPGHGGVLVLRGGAGIGKSSLLAAAERAASARGMETVSLVAVQAEVHMPFAAGHTLLGLLGLPEPPDGNDSLDHYQFQLALALLSALTARAADRPLVVLVDDAQWMDTPSWEALTFVGRRLAADPVVLIVAMRDGPETETRLTRLSVPELQVEPLSQHHSASLLSERAPDLAPELRARVLAEAAGNPLALGELAVAVIKAGPAALLSAGLPLTTRLERAFGLSVAELPEPTRALLLVAALDDGDRLGEILAAAASLTGTTLTVADAEPAVDARLIDVDEQFAVRFRHPLVRSAIRQEAGLALRQRAHAALARAVSDPDRSISHRAAATIGPDEEVAGELDDLAGRLYRRGAAGAAAPLWERAAHLTGDAARRASLLLRALEVTLEVADHERAEVISQEIVAADLPAEDQMVLQWLREVEVGGWSGAARLPGHLAAAERLHRTGRDDRALHVLQRVAVRCYFANPEPALRAQLIGLLERLDLAPLTPRLVATIGLMDPVGRGSVVAGRVSALLGRAGLTGRDLCELAAASTGVGALIPATRLGADAVALNRRDGNLISLTWALAYQAWAAVQLGDASLARSAAAEADTLAGETRQRNYVIPNMLNWGHAEALRGDIEAAKAMADQCERGLISNGAHTMLCLVRVIRGVAALAAGRHAEACEELDGIFEPAEPGYHPYVRFSVLAHLAEAAIHCGRRTDVAARIRELVGFDEVDASPLLRVTLRCARAMLDGTEEAALEADLTDWPFERARLQLLYGSRLRREQPAAARPVLREAADTFDALGARPWADRAHAELRATGETRRRDADAIDQLTPQELQVARLVAEGLSNKEIAGRLFLSPRTIGSHLYRIYPKLGVGSRTELARAMAGGRWTRRPPGLAR